MSKIAIVFGHSSGLGLETTKSLLQEGYRVVGVSKENSEIDSPELVSILADLSQKEDLKRVVGEIEQNHNSFNVLIFTAGVLAAHNIDDLSYSDMECLFKVNALAPMFVESRLLNLIKQNDADVVNVTSNSLVCYYPKFSEYSTSKAAFAKFTKDLREELKNTNSRVIDFCPSGFASNIYKNMLGDRVERDETRQMKTSDLADLILYLIKLPKKIEISFIHVNRK